MNREDAIKLLKVSNNSEENIIDSYNKRTLELKSDSSVDPIQMYVRQSKLDEARDYLLSHPFNNSDIKIVVDSEKQKNAFDLRSLDKVDHEYASDVAKLRTKELYDTYVGPEIKFLSKVRVPIANLINNFVDDCNLYGNSVEKVESLYEEYKKRIIDSLNGYIESVCYGENIEYTKNNGVYFIEGERLCAEDGFYLIHSKLLLIKSKSGIKQVSGIANEKISDVKDYAFDTVRQTASTLSDVKDTATKAVLGLFKRGK